MRLMKRAKFSMFTPKTGIMCYDSGAFSLRVIDNNFVGLSTLVDGRYLEMQAYSSHGNSFYV
jgi:hypothetical protein